MVTDGPAAAAAGVPPLTPGTNQKMTQALAASFQSFEKEQFRYSIPRGIISINRKYQDCYKQKRTLKKSEIRGPLY